jgi:hypothetical protein
MRPDNCLNFHQEVSTIPRPDLRPVFLFKTVVAMTLLRMPNSAKIRPAPPWADGIERVTAGRETLDPDARLT